MRAEESKTAVILLAGGMGTRLRGLHPDLPKPMVPVLGQPFVEWVLRYFEQQGCRNFVVTLGHLADVAERYMQERAGESRIVTTHEKELLGTGGAIRLGAQSAPDAELLIAANADSLVLTPLASALARMKNHAVDAVIVGVEVEDTSRFGALKIAGERLTGFYEKRPGKGAINAGIYIFRPRLLNSFPDVAPLSIERDVLPKLLDDGARIEVERVQAPFIDVGTPESLALGTQFIQDHFRS